MKTRRFGTAPFFALSEIFDCATFLEVTSDYLSFREGDFRVLDYLDELRNCRFPDFDGVLDVCGEYRPNQTGEADSVITND